MAAASQSCRYSLFSNCVFTNDPERLSCQRFMTRNELRYAKAEVSALSVAAAVPDKAKYLTGF